MIQSPIPMFWLWLRYLINLLHSSWYVLDLSWKQCHRDDFASPEQHLHSQGLFCSPSHQQGGWGCARSWEGTQREQLIQLTKGKFQTTWHHSQHVKWRGKEARGVGEGGCSEYWHLSSQATINATEPSFPVDNTCQTTRCDELIPCAALPNKLPLSQTRRFLTFTLLILIIWWKWVIGAWHLVGSCKPQQRWHFSDSEITCYYLCSKETMFNKRVILCNIKECKTQTKNCKQI